ncbi:cytochrome c3 family protein [Thermincola ferriacetica]
MKKFGLALALSAALLFTVGLSSAMAAPGNYPPDSTSDKFTAQLNETSGTKFTNSWDLSNGLVNANKTGEGATGTTESFATVIKNKNGQRTHGEYANDTNSCASCHQTHTASGRQLLFRNGIYNTCTACHDGTLGFYNVFADGAMASNAGTFGGDPANGASVHLATGAMKVSAAPGGNRTSTDPNTWGKDFTCASCHSPHGSYSDRLLHYNPNGLGTRTPDQGGTKIANATVAFDSATGKYTAKDSAGKAIAGPWLYGYTYGKPKVYWTQIRVKDPATGQFSYKYPGDPSKSWNDVLEVNYRGGFFTDPNGVLNGVNPADIQMDIAPATVVKMNEELLQTVAGIPVVKVTSYQKGVNAYCAACHTDYNSNSAQTETGTFSKAFRHKIVQGLKAGMIGEPDANGTPNANMVCLSCHYAHGTDNSIMKDARDQQGVSTDVNASSALKRYYNMAVCYKCHTDSKAEQLKNNDFYWNTVDAGTNPVH